MASLPSVRVQEAKAFTNTGVDYFGPVKISLGRRKNSLIYKGYVSLFICMSVKAIHLELVSSLSTNHFLQGFKRFISRRALCALYSDRGTNFVGSKSVLADINNFVNSPEYISAFETELGVQGIEWHFNSPFAPEQGGLWESNVKAVKNHIFRVIGDQLLTYEEFSTLLTEIEALLNSRPLCQLSADRTAPEALTPAHFLTLAPLRGFPSEKVDNIPVNRLDRFQLVDRMVQDFWNRWRLEYLSSLQIRKKWNNQHPNIAVGTVVILKTDNAPPLHWPLAVVTAVHPGSDGVVRNVTLKTSKGIFMRPVVKEWDDPHGETPPYHYGTHYSSAMIVCSYLVRLEPFTQHFLRLQGGHFDLADRMFHSVKEAWLSASKHNMADVKELIPEFFYLNEYLTNFNQFDLGVKQNGVALGDVVLPPWAKQDPREFIRVHRMALECDYVSQNLHHWIDLIFGYKQQSQPSIDAVNVFHHLFYEGNVDIYNIDDPLKKNATIGFINNFGQIPKQLFKKPHPCKKMYGSNSNRSSVIDTGSLVQAFSLPQPEKKFFHHLDILRPSLQPIKEVKSPVGQILHVDRTVLAVEQNKVLMPPLFNKYVAWGFADHSLRMGNYESDKAVFVSESIIQNNGEILACVCPSPKLIITAGTSSVVTVWEYESKKKNLSIKHNLYAHTDAITCLAASPAYNVIISGSRDSTAIIWDLSRGVFVRQLQGHAGPVAAVAVNDLTGDIATCAATWLHLWSINGDELANVNTCVGRADRMQQILCVAFSQTHEWDHLNVIMTGSTDGVTRMWSIDYVQVPDETTNPTTTCKPISETKSPKHCKPLHHRLIKQINVSSIGSIGGLMKSGSESSLSEENMRSPVDRQRSEESSSKEWRSEQQDEKETCSDIEECTPPLVPTRRRRSRVHGGFRKSEGGNSAECASIDIDDGSGMRTSKSDTSLTDSFVMISDAKKKTTHPMNSLRPGNITLPGMSPKSLKANFLCSRHFNPRLLEFKRLPVPDEYHEDSEPEGSSDKENLKFDRSMVKKIYKAPSKHYSQQDQPATSKMVYEESTSESTDE
ncbi:hypothetical protein JTB14_023053 [Gonioctena quinquepunctata]|nr:hypothetical protein JTB14_023053 [Gonioctena quinquepunctata]